MPTPSASEPDPPLSPRSPRLFPFSSCPDADELALYESSHPPPPPPPVHVQLPPPAQQQQQQQQPSSRVRQNPAAVQLRHRMEDTEPAPSRSPTMSPGPQTDISDDATLARASQSTTATVGRGDVEEDGPKQTDGDDDMTGVDTEGSRREGRDTDGESSGPRPSSSRRTALGVPSSRSRQRRSIFGPVVDLDDTEMFEPEGNPASWVEDSGLAGLGYELAQTRLIPTSPSSFLRPGSRFAGTQQSVRQRYDVQVEIKYVDMRESFLCGYLKIQGLTDDHPTLTTYFEGEIIGSKYGFITQHPSWGVSDKIDISHWAKFPAFRPFQKQARKGGFVPMDLSNREHIFMRWKENFLVPDHRVRTINGASFEGFYYICFNQVRGEVNGIYFHSRSEKFQQLELKHVEDRGCFGAMEFR